MYGWELMVWFVPALVSRRRGVVSDRCRSVAVWAGLDTESGAVEL
jgi:hypothetical protein